MILGLYLKSVIPFVYIAWVARIKECSMCESEFVRILVKTAVGRLIAIAESTLALKPKL